MEPESTDCVVKDEKIAGAATPRPIEYVDVELVRRTKNGDVDAFEELFNHYQKRVYNVIFQMVRDENEAADLTQETFVRVFNCIRSLKAEEAFFTWVRTVAVNLCRDHARRKPPVRVESLDEKLTLDSNSEVERQIADHSANPEKTYQSRDLQQAVQRAVSTLSEDHRAVVVLHHLQGMDIQDIAKTLGCPVGTVKSRLARARDHLRRKLAGYVDAG